MKEDCIFCKIIAKELTAKYIPSQLNEIIVIYDLHPKANSHLLFIPKKHISSLIELEKTDKVMLGELLFEIHRLAKELQLNSYKLIVNNGSEANQEIMHLHFHLLSNDSIVIN